MQITIVPMTSESEAMGKAYVHCTAWKQAYRGLLSQDFLDARTLELSEKMALRAFRVGYSTLLAKDSDEVVGFADYGPYRGDDIPNAGEVYAIYLLSDYYGRGIGARLMSTALQCMPDRDRIIVWVLEGNERAIRFYERFGFRFDGESQTLNLGGEVTELRMVLERHYSPAVPKNVLRSAFVDKRGTVKMEKKGVWLEPLQDSDREQFILDNQEAFNFGALEEFGRRDDHFEEDGQIISRDTIEQSIDEGEAWRIVLDGEKVGGAVVKVDGERGELELLFTSPHAHSRGIGYAAWCEIEKAYPQVKVWGLVTPYFEKRNIHFYVNRCGFHIVEFFNSHHPDPNDPDAGEHGEGGQFEDGMFRFEKRLG